MGQTKFVRPSLQALSTELGQQGFSACPSTVGRLLRSLNYSPRINAKRFTGPDHPDRDRQFQNIEEWIAIFEELGQPIISVDAKKTAMWGIGGTRVYQQCTDGPCPVNLTVCSVAQDHRPPGGHLCQRTDHVSPFWHIRGATPHSPIRRWWSDRAPRFLTALRRKELTTLYGPLGRTAR